MRGSQSRTATREIGLEDERRLEDIRYGPEIGTAWLLLSHGAWLGAPIVSMGVVMAAMISYSITGNTVLRANAIAIACLGLLYSLWTLYAMILTWMSNCTYARPVFGNASFSLAVTLVLATLAVGIWTLVTSIQL